MISKELEYKIKMRQKANMEILRILKEYLENYPDMRFGQALMNLDILHYKNSKYENSDSYNVQDPFNYESVDMLAYIQKRHGHQIKINDIREL